MDNLKVFCGGETVDQWGTFKWRYKTMKKENFKVEKFPEEIATELYEKAKDMDFTDYEDEKEQIISEIENALYWLKAAAENDYNHDYFRTFYKILERI